MEACYRPGNEKVPWYPPLDGHYSQAKHSYVLVNRYINGIYMVAKPPCSI